MGVGYGASAGYGFVLDSESLKGFAEMSGYIPYGYNSYEEAVADEADMDLYDIADALGNKFGINHAVAGNGYSGDLEYLFGEIAANMDFGFQPATIDLKKFQTLTPPQTNVDSGQDGILDCMSSDVTIEA